MLASLSLFIDVVAGFIMLSSVDIVGAIVVSVATDIAIIVIIVYVVVTSVVVTECDRCCYYTSTQYIHPNITITK